MYSCQFSTIFCACILQTYWIDSANFSVHFNTNIRVIFHLFLRLFPANIMDCIVPNSAFILTEILVLYLSLIFASVSCNNTGFIICEGNTGLFRANFSVYFNGNFRLIYDVFLRLFPASVCVLVSL